MVKAEKPAENWADAQQKVPEWKRQQKWHGLTVIQNSLSQEMFFVQYKKLRISPKFLPSHQKISPGKNHSPGKSLLCTLCPTWQAFTMLWSLKCHKQASHSEWMYVMYENVQHLRKASESHEGLPQSWAELHVWHLWKSMWVIISTTPACKKTQEYCLQYVWKVFQFKGRVEWAQKIAFKIFLWRVWSNIYLQEWCEKAHAYYSQWRYSMLHVQEAFLQWNGSLCQSKASWDIVLFVIWVSKSVKKHKAKFFQMTSFCSMHHFIHIICHPPEVEF